MAHQLVIDLSGATFIDSYMMGTFIKAKRNAVASDRVFSLVVDPDSVVARAMDIAEVLPLLNSVATLDEALADE